MTFNEFIPDLFSKDESFMYYLLSGLQLDDLFFSVYGDGEDVSRHYDINFRIKNNNRMMSDIITQSFYELTGKKTMDNAELQEGWIPVLLLEYQNKWKKLLENVYSQAYEPIYNYDRTEDDTTVKTGELLKERLYDNTVDNTDTHTSTDKSNSNNKSNSQKNIYAFNSDNFSPSDSDEGVSQSTGERETTATDTHKEAVEYTENERTQYDNITDKRTVRAYGNIGVTTTQQMLESEIILREKHNFITTMYNDISKTLFNDIYYN